MALDLRRENSAGGEDAAVAFGIHNDFDTLDRKQAVGKLQFFRKRNYVHDKPLFYVFFLSFSDTAERKVSMLSP